MPFKASLAPPGPQNIEVGTITLNEVEVHSGFTQCFAGMIKALCRLYKVYSVTDVCISGVRGGEFACTSSEALNLVFEDLARSIDYEEGLKKLEISNFGDKNTLEKWALSQLVFKSHHLQQLTIKNLGWTTAANRSKILEFAGLAATSSSCLQKIHI